MKIQQIRNYGIALAIIVIGLALAGVPLSTLLIAGIVLVCPLMMLTMHGGSHGSHGSQDGSHQHGGHSDEDDHDHRPSSGRS